METSLFPGPISWNSKHTLGWGWDWRWGHGYGLLRNDFLHFSNMGPNQKLCDDNLSDFRPPHSPEKASMP